MAEKRGDAMAGDEQGDAVSKRSTIDVLANRMMLGDALEMVRMMYGRYELLAHWLQGEFHHDLLLRLPQTEKRALPGDFLLIATNCNGGIKEVMCFAEEPERWALWHHRCPDNPEFGGILPTILAIARTVHWFNPCQLLEPETRSELRADKRRRQRGGGWRSIYDLED